MIKRTSKEDPQYDDLVDGLACTRRIADRVNEAQRRAENVATCELLETRVQDWKGHHIKNFGLLLLDDMFSVSKSEVDRDYHVFLFEKIILCCKEAVPNGAAVVGKNGRMSKSNSILKKTSGAPVAPPMTSAAKRKTSPLLLKGRIFLSNVTGANAVRRDGTLSWLGFHETFTDKFPL